MPNRETLDELLHFSEVNFKAVEKGFAKVLTLRFSEDGSILRPTSTHVLVCIIYIVYFPCLLGHVGFRWISPGHI